jgi:hypothetical protein
MSPAALTGAFVSVAAGGADVRTAGMVMKSSFFSLLPGNILQDAETDEQHRRKRQQNSPGVKRNATKR